MRRLYTIRQRRHRAQKGQVAAVATILALLLIVTGVVAFGLDPLPAEMANVELVHDIQVQDQIGRLQAQLLAEVHAQAEAYPLSSPVTLGSGTVEPFGEASTSSVGAESSQIHAWTQVAVGDVQSAPPNWNVGSACLFNGSGHCSSNGNIDTWNITGVNNTAFTVTVNGNKNSMRYNISGNNDTITLDWTGGDTGFVQFILNGSDDVINFNKGGSDTTNPVMQFLIYGQRDTFNYNPSGSHSTKGGVFLTVAFIGELGPTCPTLNLSNTDKIGTLSPGGSNLAMSVIWWNFVGYRTAPSAETYPGGAGNNETITWQNESGVVGCAFTRSFSTNLPAFFAGGLAVHEYNRYIPPADVALEEGAVIYYQQGGTPIMIDPPPFQYKVMGSSTTANLTLLNTIGNPPTETGLLTASVEMRLLSVQRFGATTGVTQDTLLSPLGLNITTNYPSAWVTYFASLPQFYPFGSTCIPSIVISAPYTCTNPPPGVPVTIETFLLVQHLTLTTATIAINLT